MGRVCRDRRHHCGGVQTHRADPGTWGHWTPSRDAEHEAGPAHRQKGSVDNLTAFYGLTPFAVYLYDQEEHFCPHNP